MSLIQLLLAAEAAEKQQAIRRTVYAHRYVSATPFVVSLYNLSGEAAAPLGFMFGTSRDGVKLLTCPEPRNRDERFRTIHAFCRNLTSYLDGFRTLDEKQGKDGKTWMEARAVPQIVVPNRATREFLCRRLGRSIRYLHLNKKFEVPESTKWAGAYLAWFADQALVPGQSVFVAATELLSRHFVTGQSELENENLKSLLAWIRNPPRSGLDQIQAAEAAAFGPAPDPDWEELLAPMIQAWNEGTRAGNSAKVTKAKEDIAQHVEPPLKEGYLACWDALDAMRAFRPARSVEERWGGDRRAWSTHVFWGNRELPRFTKRHNAIRAARSLEDWSRALESLEYQEALEDPLVMAELDAAGRCVIGTVEEVDEDNREVKPGRKNKTPVPLVTVALEGPCHLLKGEKVLFTEDDRVEGQIRSVSEGLVVIAIMGGHKGGSRLPETDDRVTFAALDVFDGRSPRDPKEVPWTHREATGEKATATEADEQSHQSHEEILRQPGVVVDLESVSGVSHE